MDQTSPVTETAEYVKGICKSLRDPGTAFVSHKKAADLIETLYLMTLGVAQRSEEPVAWRWRAVSWGNHWIYDPSKEWRELRQADPELEFQPLYVAVSDTSTDSDGK